MVDGKKINVGKSSADNDEKVNTKEVNNSLK